MLRFATNKVFEKKTSKMKRKRGGFTAKNDSLTDD